MPKGLGAEIDLNSWELPPVFKWLCDVGGVSQPELLKTFNAGLGMVAVVAPDRAQEIADDLRSAGETVFEIGTVSQTEGVQYSGSLV
jgi:phosphoribosylformylglycinamidine cyclo-ligase